MFDGELPVVAYDIDDTMFSFHEPFISWAEEQYDIDLSQPRTNDFNYDYRFPHIEANWADCINEFTITRSVSHMSPEAGITKHLTTFAGKIQPVAITSRPKHHRRQTEMLISKYLAEFFPDIKIQLIMPDESVVNNVKPTKLAICQKLNAIAIFDDAVHNVANFVETENNTKPFLFRTKHTLWNHSSSELPDGVENVVELPDRITIVEGWDEATRELERYINQIKHKL